MRTRVLLGALAFLVACTFVVPANAANIGGTDFALFGKTAVKMEDSSANPASPGFLKIDGNVGVNDVGGLLRIGKNNIITGTAIADKMFFGQGASVGTCVFNTSTGGNPAAVCGTIVSPAPAGTFPLVTWPPLAVPVPTPNSNNQVCPLGGVLALAPGDYGNLTVNDDCVLDLSAGTYSFKRITVGTGAVINGNGAVINMTGSFVTEPGVTINDVKVTTTNTGTFEAIVIGNSSTINGSVFYAPNARMHLHQGGVYDSSEFIAVFITVEPVQITVTPQGCACVGELKKSGTTILLSNGCGLNNSSNTYFLDKVCETCPGGAGCVAVTVQAGATPTNATLNIPAGLPAGDYHVIVNSPAGSFCTSTLLTLP